MSKEERYAAGFRMIHPKEGYVRSALGVALVGAGAYIQTPHHAAPVVSWPDLAAAAGVMLWNMGRRSQ